MAKYVCITGDYNDGDSTIKIKKISDENIVRLKGILESMPKDGKVIRYETREIGDDDKPGSSYCFISDEEKKFLDKYLPTGEPNYLGIHTIESVKIYEQLEVLL